MLRAVVLGLGCLVLALGLTLLLLGRTPAGVAPTFIGLLLLAGTLFEQKFYKKPQNSPPAGADWEMTSERFLDPETGKLMVVWFNRTTGERSYVQG